MINYIKHIAFLMLVWFEGIHTIIPYYVVRVYVDGSIFSVAKLIFITSCYIFSLKTAIIGMVIFGTYELIYRHKLVMEIFMLAVSADKMEIEGKETLHVAKLYDVTKKYTAIIYNKIINNILYRYIKKIIKYVYGFKDNCIVKCMNNIINIINIYISITLQYISKYIRKIPYMDKYVYKEFDILDRKYQKINKMFKKNNIGYNQLIKSVQSMQSIMNGLDKMPMLKKFSQRIMQNEKFNDILDSVDGIFSTKKNSKDNELPFNINSMIRAWKNESKKKSI